jgi:glycosyltransferase involved in cell wall biosynthesis
MKFSIVIPAWEHFDLTGNLLMDIYQNCHDIHEVIVVDNGSKKEETWSGYDFWLRVLDFPLRIVKIEENVGFLKASNQGLREATGDIVALISNDVLVKKDLGKLCKEIFTTPHDKILLGGKIYRASTGWNEFDGKIFPYVEGWTLIATSLGWKELGYFDERYSPNDFEDICLSTTALGMGYSLEEFRPWHGEVLEHLVARSLGYTEERRKITERNRELFREKWITKNE